MPLIVSKAGKSRLSGERRLRKGGCLQQIEEAGAGGWGLCFVGSLWPLFLLPESQLLCSPSVRAVRGTRGAGPRGLRACGRACGLACGQLVAGAAAFPFAPALTHLALRAPCGPGSPSAQLPHVLASTWLIIVCCGEERRQVNRDLSPLSANSLNSFLLVSPSGRSFLTGSERSR